MIFPIRADIGLVFRDSEIAERRKLAAADLFAALTDEEKEQLASILDKLGAELDKRRPKRCAHRSEKAEPEGDAEQE